MSNFTISFHAMGCQVQVWINVADAAIAQILRAAPIWFEQWESRFSRFRATSELCALNASAGEWFPASAEMCDVIRLALDAAAMTNGLFNPLVLPAVEAAGYTHSFTPDGTFVPGDAPQNDAAYAAQVPSWQTIRLDVQHRCVQLPPHTRIDLGGIVKGWAAQQTADRLAQWGACLVDAGGDMAAHGSPDESGGWQVVIAHQYELSSVLGMVTVTDAAIATSGIDYRHWERDGHMLHHLIDPRTGQPAAGTVLTTTVVAPTAVEAEAMAKATLIAGNCDLPTEAGYPALIVHTDLSVSYNEEFRKLCPTLPASLSDAKAVV